MNIGLELGLNTEGARGVDAYYRGLIGGLAELDSVNHYFLFSYFFKNFEAKKKFLPQPHKSNFQRCYSRWPESLVTRMEWSWHLPVIDFGFARRKKLALYHCLGGRLPKIGKAKTIITIHDPLSGTIPGCALESGRDMVLAPLDPILRYSIQKADHVIGISEFTLKLMAQYYSIDRNKMTAIHYGLDHSRFQPRPHSVLEPVRRRYALPENFLLFLGPFEMRRNAERVFQALASLRKEGIGKGYRLLFAGRRNDYFSKIEAAASEFGLLEDVRCLGHISHDDLPAVYQLAFALVHPTLYENFGFPILEAMACGTPVLSSNTSAIPEVAADGALLVNPERVEALADGLRKIFTQSSLRSELSEKGKKRAQFFSWEKAARETTRLYERMIEANP